MEDFDQIDPDERGDEIAPEALEVEEEDPPNFPLDERLNDNEPDETNRLLEIEEYEEEEMQNEELDETNAILEVEECEEEEMQKEEEDPSILKEETSEMLGGDEEEETIKDNNSKREKDLPHPSDLPSKEFSPSSGSVQKNPNLRHPSHVPSQESPRAQFSGPDLKEPDLPYSSNLPSPKLPSYLAAAQKDLGLEQALADPSTGPPETEAQKEYLLKGTSQTRRFLASPSIPLSAEWIYRASAPVIQNPYNPANVLCRRLKAEQPVYAYGKPNSSRRRLIRNVCVIPSTNPYGLKSTEWEVNPVVTVPMRARPWKARKPLPAAVEEWKEREQVMKESRDQHLALTLGYDTLVGNLVHINIPGSRDLNRSWRHFLNKKDDMAWGFPYSKGSLERPQEPSPPPYLVYELKEKFWRHPRSRSYKTAQ